MTKILALGIGVLLLAGSCKENPSSNESSFLGKWLLVREDTYEPFLDTMYDENTSRMVLEISADSIVYFVGDHQCHWRKSFSYQLNGQFLVLDVGQNAAFQDTLEFQEQEGKLVYIENEISDSLLMEYIPFVGEPVLAHWAQNQCE